MTGVLDEIHRSVSAFRDLAARPATLRPQGGSQPPRAGGGKSIEQLQKTHDWKDGPNGWGWYKKVKP
jgi:hypothetical protein